MVSGKFELPDEVTSHQLVEGKYSLAPLYKVSPLARNQVSSSDFESKDLKNKIIS